MYRSLALAPLMSLLVLGCHDGKGSAPDAGPPPVDQCVNAPDLAIANSFASQLDGGVPDGGFPDAGRTDGLVTDDVVYALGDTVLGCLESECITLVFLESPDLGPCLTGCLGDTPAAGLSLGCTGCWVDSTRCGAGNCLTVCAQDQTSASCRTCLDTHCLPAFADCTGFDITTYF